jgi:hypothetical protein
MSISRRPSREERAVLGHYRRHEAAIRVQDILTVLAAEAMYDTGGKLQDIGLAMAKKSSAVMQDAEASLPPEDREMFHRFRNESQAHSYRDLLWIQQVGAEGIVQMINDSPLYQSLPPEKKGVLQRGFEFIFGSLDSWD